MDKFVHLKDSEINFYSFKEDLSNFCTKLSEKISKLKEKLFKIKQKTFLIRCSYNKRAKNC